MRNFCLSILLLSACDLPADPSEVVELREFDPHPAPDPPITCAKILWADMRPISGQGGLRSVVISGFECVVPIKELKIAVGPGPMNDLSRDHWAGITGSIPAGGCYQMSGIAAKLQVPDWGPACFPSGDWPVWHVALIDGPGNILDSVEIPTDLEDWGKDEGPSGPVGLTEKGQWIPTGDLEDCAFVM